MTLKAMRMKSMVTSIALYGCETWTYSRKLEKRLDCIRTKVLPQNAEYNMGKSREEDLNLIGEFEPLLTTAKRRHVSTHNDAWRNLGGERKRQPRETWLMDIKKWTGLVQAEAMGKAKDRDR